MTKAQKTWIVIADGARARIVIPAEIGSTYTTNREFASADTHKTSHELGFSQPGRTQESATTVRHAIQPRTDLHEEAKQRFAREVASALNAAHTRKEFDRILLVALPRFAAYLREGLDETVRQVIAGEIPKDLTKVPNHDLAPHLEAVGHVR